MKKLLLSIALMLGIISVWGQEYIFVNHQPIML